MISKLWIKASQFVLSVRGRLMLTLVIMAVIPALVIGVLAYDSARDTIEERLHVQLNSVADLKQAEISGWINLVVSDTRLLADNFLNEEHITVILDEAADPELQRLFGNFLTENLLSLQQTRLGYEEIFYVDMGGRVILSTDPNQVGRNASAYDVVGNTFNSADGDYIQDVFRNGNNLEMAFGHVLHQVELDKMQVSGNVNAAVIIRVDLKKNLYPILSEWPAKGETGETFIVTKRGDQFIFISPLRFDENAALIRALPDNLQFDELHRVNSDRPDDIQQVRDYRSVEVLRAFREIPEMGWGFLTKQDRAEAFTPVTRLTSIWVAVTVVILIAALWGAALLARSLSRPLKVLTEAARKVEEGDFNTNVVMDRRDEFGEMANAFNKMVAAVRSHAHTIQKNSEELQAMVNLSDTLLGSVNVQATLESALSEAISATGAESGAAVLNTDAGDEIVIEAAVGLPQDIVGSRFPLNRLTAAGYVILQKNPAVSVDVASESRFRVPPFILELGVVSNMATPMQIDDHVIGALVLDTFSTHEFTQDEVDITQAIANQTAVALERIKLISDLSDSYDRTLAALVAALDARDKETEGHSKRVVAYTLALAEKMDIHKESMKDIARGALLHDIGKIGVPDNILHKTGPLNKEEWEIIKKHPEWGEQILKDIPFLKTPSEMVLAHHERSDGTGYPLGISTESIPIGARIFAVADAFDAMTSNRPYREAKSFKKARAEILAGRETQFDAEVVDIFMQFSERGWQRLRVSLSESGGLKTVGSVQDVIDLRRTVTGQLESLNVIIAAISSSLDMREVLQNTVDTIVDVTQAAAAGIFLHDAEHDRMAFASDHDFPEEMKIQLDHSPVDEFIAHETLVAGRSEFYKDIDEVSGFEKMKLKEMRPKWLSYACVPLAEEEAIVGVMALFSETPYVFDSEDLQLFEKVGRQLGKTIINVRIHERVRYQAITDALTGAYNRHYLDDFLDIEVKRSQRYERPMALIMLDMDHFKECNDRSGHQAGDDALRDVVQLLNLGVRSVDMVARYGGEEFLIVLPETDSKGALEVAERVRALIQGHEFPCGEITASLGVVACEFGPPDKVGAEELISRADQALFEAKQAGRNRVRVWSEKN